ncbi:hypothetical protein [Moorena sp. SIO4G3]|uniref:hypothetical protein n=1 Tax=Moorena sp. SIO4G3 TaxID=2607821 RepID=UPI00142B750B|nr:hypothetical protein [Moorena sp. SIO4G3]NEO81151.1 hypothetical protein [Moorena sp. SIO4G3]
MSPLESVNSVLLYSSCKREQGTGNRESGVGNRESGIGNRESGVGSRESGRNPVYLMSIRIAIAFCFDI